MRRSTLLIAAIALAATGLYGCAGPKEAVQDVAQATPGLSAKDTGVIEQVEGNRIAIRSAEKPGGVAWYQRTDDTKITEKDRPLDWANLEEGDAVRVSFESQKGAERLYKLEVLTGGDAAKVREDARLLKEGKEGTEHLKD